MIAGEHNYGITPYTNYKSKGNITKRIDRIEKKTAVKLMLRTTLTKTK